MRLLERRHYLLAAGGINTDEALRDLDSIDFQATFEPSSIRVDTDIDVRVPSLGFKDYHVTDQTSVRPISATGKNKM